MSRTEHDHVANLQRRIAELRAENARLKAAVKNVVTMIPNKNSCALPFWHVVLQCRKLLGDNRTS